MIPPEVLEDARGKVADSGLERSVGYIGAVVIVLVRIIVLVGVLRLMKIL